MDRAFLASRIPQPVVSGLNDLKFMLDEHAHNPRVGQLLNTTVLAGGKRVRPLLALLMGDFFGLVPTKMAPYACDIERIHAATLAHDDVVDNATQRRGLASINVVATNKKAVLAGDYLLAKVLLDVASRGDNRIVQELSQVIADLAEGEWLQIENTSNRHLSWDDVIAVARRKTASVMRWCCVAPCYLAGGSADLVALCADFGEQLGIAFQLGDDILDFQRKDAQGLADLKNGVISGVIFHALAADHATLDMVAFRTESPLSLDDAAITHGIRKTRQAMEACLDRALELFSMIQEQVVSPPVSGEPTIAAISAILEYLRVRT